jgi:hypothetical protein
MSEETKDPFMKGAVWIGLAILLPSAVGIFAILNANAESFDLAPGWIAFTAVLMFFNCGIVVGALQLGGFWAGGTRIQRQHFHPFSCN